MAWDFMYTQSQRRLAMTRQEIQTNNEPKAATDGKVGYKHPPVKSQFRKGKSGNPRGRRKGQRNLEAVLAEVLRQTVTVKQGGKAQRMSKGEALIQILLTKAHHGDGRAIKATLYLAEKIARIETPELKLGGPWQKPPSKRSREILLLHDASRSKVRRQQFERRAGLVSAIARGRRWLDDVVSGRVTTVTQLCAREKCSVRQVNMTISLAFLAPNLVKAAVEGRLPRGIGVERLRDPPAEWSRQFEALGLNPE